MENRVTIKIPRSLYCTLKDQIANTGFSSVNEFIVFVMRFIASTGEMEDGQKLAENDLLMIRDRLKRLGYFREG